MKPASSNLVMFNAQWCFDHSQMGEAYRRNSELRLSDLHTAHALSMLLFTFNAKPSRDNLEQSKSDSVHKHGHYAETVLQLLSQGNRRSPWDSLWSAVLSHLAESPA